MINQVVTLHSDVNYDPTLRECSPVARLLFVLALAVVDDHGRYPLAKGLSLGRTMSHVTGLPAEVCEAGVAELAAMQLAELEGPRLTIPRFVDRQHRDQILLNDRWGWPPRELGDPGSPPVTSLREVRQAIRRPADPFLPASPPSPTSAPPPSAATAPTIAPRAPDAADEPSPPAATTTVAVRYVYPLVEGETAEARKRRLDAERKKKARRGTAPASRGVSPSECGTAPASGSDTRTRPGLSGSVRVGHPDTSGSDTRTSRASGLCELSDGSDRMPQQTQGETLSSLQRHPNSDPSEGARDVRVSDPDAGAVPHPTRTPRVRVSDPDSPAALRVRAAGEGDVSHVDDLLDQIGRGASGRFPGACSTERKRAMARVEAELERAKADPRRWEIFGAWLAAGAHGQRAKSRPGTLPDIAYFLPPYTGEFQGQAVTLVQEEFLLRSVRLALEWDAEGRGPVVQSPPPPAAPASPATGARARPGWSAPIPPASVEAHAQSRDLMLRATGSASGVVSTELLDELLKVR